MSRARNSHRRRGIVGVSPGVCNVNISISSVAPYLPREFFPLQEFPLIPPALHPLHVTNVGIKYREKGNPMKNKKDGERRLCGKRSHDENCQRQPTRLVNSYKNGKAMLTLFSVNSSCTVFTLF